MTFEEAVAYLRSCGLVANIIKSERFIVQGDEILSGGTAYDEERDFGYPPENWFVIICEKEDIKFQFKADMSRNFTIICKDLEQACRFACKLLTGETPFSDHIRLSGKSTARLTEAGLQVISIVNKGTAWLKGGSLDLDRHRAKKLILNPSELTKVERNKAQQELTRGFRIRTWGEIIIGEIREFGISEGAVA